MREIKFRQRLKKQFCHGEDIFHYWGYIDNCFVSPMGKNETEGDSEQFIDKKDHDGVDIYEGDILDQSRFPEDDACPFEVVFEDGAFRASYPSWDGGINKPLLNESELKLLDYRKIGNIHQNPELLLKG